MINSLSTNSSLTKQFWCIADIIHSVFQLKETNLSKTDTMEVLNKKSYDLYLKATSSLLRSSAKSEKFKLAAQRFIEENNLPENEHRKQYSGKFRRLIKSKPSQKLLVRNKKSDKIKYFLV